MVYHDIVGLDITMHYAFAVAEIQGLLHSKYKTPKAATESDLEKFQYVKSNVIVCELGIQAPEVRVVDILKNERGSLALTIPYNIQ